MEISKTPVISTLVLSCLFAISALSCRNPSLDPSTYIPSSISFNTLTPIDADDTTIRWQIAGDSIEGWLSPKDGTLRFPVVFKKGAKFTTTLSMLSDLPPDQIEFTLKAEFVPIRNGNPGRPGTIFELGRDNKLALLNRTFPVTVPLDKWAPGSGEIRLTVGGQQSSNNDIEIFWGQPAVYNPLDRKHRNVLLIGVDTLRADSCSPYGADPRMTPYLSEFASTGVVFKNSHSQAPWTLPSFASILTGRMPSAIAATGYNERFPEFSDTIGEILREHGYATMMVASNPWLGNKNSGFEQGMDTLWFRNDARANVTTARAKDFIQKNSDRDWFCFLHINDPHTTYEPMLEYVDMFCDPSYAGPYEEKFTQVDDWSKEGFRPSDSEIAQVRGLYNGEVAFVDKNLGEFFKWMNDNGYSEDTLIIFTADHGEEFFEHGKFGHGYSQYDELVRTPLIISGPDFPAGKNIDTPVGNTDIVPTVLKFANIDLPENLIGTPLQDIAGGSSTVRRPILGDETGQVVRKYVLDWPFKGIADFVTGNIEVYNLETDPFELDDISDSVAPDILNNFLSTAMAGMHPVQDIFIVGFLGNPNEPGLRFSGTIQISGGYDIVHKYAFDDSDEITENSDSINFNIIGTRSGERESKILVIYPSAATAELNMNLKINGKAPGDENPGGRFFPYGTSVPEPSGVVTIRLDGFPWPASLPDDYMVRQSSCYILADDGYSEETITNMHDELSPEERDRLRALGYLN